MLYNIFIDSSLIALATKSLLRGEVCQLFVWLNEGKVHRFYFDSSAARTFVFKAVTLFRNAIFERANFSDLSSRGQLHC